MSHPSLVGHKSCQVRGFGCIILRERSNLPSMLLGTFLGEEPKGSVAWGFKFSMGHGGDYCE